MWGVVALLLVGWWVASALGLLPVGLQDLFWRALPALLILFGLTLLLRNRIPLGGAVALLVTVALVGAIIYTAYSSRAGQQNTDSQQIIDQPIDRTLTLVRVRLTTLATDVEIVTSSASSVGGTFTGSRDHQITTDYQLGGDGTSTLTIDEISRSGDFPLLETMGRGTLTILIPEGIPIDLQLRATDGDVLLNLGSTALERLNVTAISGDLVAALPDYDPVYSQPDDMLGTLTADAGDLALIVPVQVAARLELDRRGSGIAPQFDGTRYDYLQGDVLQGVDIRTASKVVRYALAAGRGEIRIESSS